MSIYNIEVPEFNTVDALAEARELRDQRTRARMSRKAYIDAILEGMRDAMEERGNPLAELAETLWDAPIQSAYDFKAFLHMRDGQRLGKSILTVIAEASQREYEAADVEGF